MPTGTSLHMCGLPQTMLYGFVLPRAMKKGRLVQRRRRLKMMLLRVAYLAWFWQFSHYFGLHGSLQRLLQQGRVQARVSRYPEAQFVCLQVARRLAIHPRVASPTRDFPNMPFPFPDNCDNCVGSPDPQAKSGWDIGATKHGSSYHPSAKPDIPNHAPRASSIGGGEPPAAYQACPHVALHGVGGETPEV